MLSKQFLKAKNSILELDKDFKELNEKKRIKI